MNLRRVKRNSSESNDSSRDFGAPHGSPVNSGPYTPLSAPYDNSAPSILQQAYSPPSQQGFALPSNQLGCLVPPVQQWFAPPPPASGAPAGWNPGYGKSQYPLPYSAGDPQMFNIQFFQDPMASVAMQYGREMVNQKLEKMLSLNRLKYYFAVDTAYVAKKLGLIIFPFHHTNWAIKFNGNEPVVPRYEVNAPDLYVPSMAFVTYILFSGYLLGLQNKFSPEHLGIQASSTLGWILAEVCVLMLTMYVMQIRCTTLRFYDLVAYSGYKFVIMIACLAGGFLMGSPGYMSVLAYGSLALGFFLVRSLRIALLSSLWTDQHETASRRILYFLLSICFFQPLIIYWMTHRLAVLPSVPVSEPTT